MKKYFLLLIIILLMSGAKKTSPGSPSGLMVEFIREPLCVPIMDLKPEFSWIVPAEAESQTAYQILIASSAENLNRNHGDIWDSKRVDGSGSTEVESGRETLENNTSYFWKVRIWDKDKRPSGYSDIQKFKTGFANDYLTTGNRYLTSVINPVSFVRLGNSHYFADFGKDAFGTMVFEIDPVKDDTLIIHLGEKTIEKNKIDRNPGGSIRYHRILLPVKPGRGKYILDIPVDKRNTGPAAIQLPDSFGVITPFRYCEVENCRFSLKASDLSQKAYWYFTENLSSFTSSDTILNKAWEISKYSIKATSFAGIYVDGDRERIPYEADAYINQLGHYYTDREYSMARRTNEYFIKHPTWPTEWILQTVPMFFNDFMFTGNPESVLNYYEELKNKTLFALARQDGLISSKNCTDEIMKNLGFNNAKERLRDIIDWPPSQKDTGWKLATPEGERDGYDMVEINTVVNAFYYHGLNCMTRLAECAGKKGDADFFRMQAERVKKSFNEKLLSKITGIYIDGESSLHSSLHANMIALAFDLVPDENRMMVIDFIKSRGMACSVYGAQYLLEGLYNAGEGDYAFSLLTATNDRSWWNMIRSGSTITMEAWDMKFKPNSDWNHAWGAAPANIIPGYMWGIEPVEPGYAKAVIKPQLSKLKQSMVSVPTIRGNILAQFIDTGKTKEYTITIPANMECDFIVTAFQNLTIVLNNKKVRTETGILKLSPGLNIIRI